MVPVPEKRRTDSFLPALLKKYMKSMKMLQTVDKMVPGAMHPEPF